MCHQLKPSHSRGAKQHCLEGWWNTDEGVITGSSPLQAGSRKGLEIKLYFHYNEGVLIIMNVNKGVPVIEKLL
jgi:hypothetical protein